jgi:hypothetical protein
MSISSSRGSGAGVLLPGRRNAARGARRQSATELQDAFQQARVADPDYRQRMTIEGLIAALQLAVDNLPRL